MSADDLLAVVGAVASVLAALWALGAVLRVVRGLLVDDEADGFEYEDWLADQQPAPLVFPVLPHE